MKPTTLSLRAPIVLAALLTILSPGTSHLMAGDLQRSVEGKWRGAWVLTATDVYSDCAGLHTNNRVSGTLVSSRGRTRFRPGELAQVGKVDLKRSRVDILVGLPEPILVPYQDGPFTLYNEARCLVELNVELGSKVDANGIDAALGAVLKRFNNQEEAQQARIYNRRKRDPYPAGYDRTLAEHAAWKAQQANAAVQSKLDKALEETGRLTDRLSSEPDYLKGFAAGVEAMRAVDLGKCGDLMSRDFTNVAPAQKSVAVAGFSGEAAARYGRGFLDGQRLVYGLECLRRLPQCMVPVPEVPGDRAAR
jgi:hypothetical protein